MERRTVNKFIGYLLSLGFTSPLLAFERKKGIDIKSKLWDTGDHAFITKASSYKAEIVSAKEITNKERSTTKEVQEKTGAHVVTNGSFFEEDYTPSGLYIRKKEIIKELVPGKGDGILYTNSEGQIHIIHGDNYNKHKENIVDAVQLTLLSINEEILHNRNYEHRRLPRNLVGLNDKGLVDVIFKNTNFACGDDYMKDSFNCHTVAALDGGPMASAYNKSGETSFENGDMKELPVPNFLVLYEKTK